MHNNRIIICDVEATCWRRPEEALPTDEPQGAQPNEVIEIGACELDTRTGVISNKTSIVIQPKYSKVSAFCTELTGWTQADVDGGRQMFDALRKFDDIFQPKSNDIWASYGAYDRNMLASTGKGSIGILYGIRDNQNPFEWMRTHLNIKTLFSLRHHPKREVGMAKALNILKLPLAGRHHNGADDAMNIAEIAKHTLFSGNSWDPK